MDRIPDLCRQRMHPQKIEIIKGLAIVIVSLSFFASLNASAHKVALGSVHELQFTFSDVVKKSSPSVVNISAERVVARGSGSRLFSNPFFDEFFGRDRGRTSQENSLGSGVIIDASGIIVTNHHVVEQAFDIIVSLQNGQSFTAKLIRSVPEADLAFLQMDHVPADLPDIVFANSDEVEVGDLVLAIGNPFSLGQSVSSGIISAVERIRREIKDDVAFLQTDAAINPGNSGGALVSVEGELVGINTAIFSRSGGNVGIGFAVPSNLVRHYLAGLTGDGDASRGWLGISVIDFDGVKLNRIDEDVQEGAVITNLYPGTAAARSGLRPGDVIVSINGHVIRSEGNFNYRQRLLRFGDVASIRVSRMGQLMDVALTIEAVPGRLTGTNVLLEGDHPLDGVLVTDLTPALALDLDMSPFETGAVVIETTPGRFGTRLGLKRGYLIRAVQDKVIEDVRSLEDVLRTHRSSRWSVTIDDGRRRRTIMIR